ncbi:MAG: polysaccharide deacetylase family protein [Phycisphaerales bacterium]|nr:polysaccharide deacetylase family protein [Phycisphaerales bacterium]
MLQRTHIFYCALLFIALLMPACQKARGTRALQNDSLLTKNTPDSLLPEMQSAVPITNASALSDSFVEDTNKYYVYLTFDDGPQRGTLTCLNIFKKLGVKATFFIIANNLYDKQQINILEKIRSNYPNIEIGNHSFSHADSHYKKFYSHPDSALLDFLVAQTMIDPLFKIIRLPGRSAWVNQSGLGHVSKELKPLCHLLDSMGFDVIGWDEEWNFTRDKFCNPVESPGVLARRIKNDLYMNKCNTPKHLVLLAHDRMFRAPNYADSLYKMISILKEDPRITFEIISHYPHLKNNRSATSTR